MSENTTHVDATPEQVFDVLLDGWAYADWVVGADRIRAVDSDWPAVGSRFHHTIGVGPLKTHDTSEIVELDAPRRLVLKANMGPAGAALVTVTVTANDGGSDVAMEEAAIEGPAAKAPDAVEHGALFLRNAESLRRLKHLVEERATSP